MVSGHHCRWRREAARLLEQLGQRDALLAEKDTAIAVLTAKLRDVEHELAILKKQVIGPKTERMPTPDEEAKKRARPEGDRRGGHTGPEKRKRNAEVFASLQTDVVNHRISDEHRRCPSCGEEVVPFVPDSGDVSFEYEWVPGRLMRKKHVVETGRCPCKQHYARGPAPPRVEEGTTFGPAFIAKLVVDKCGDAIPIYRLEKRMRRCGIPLSRSTMNSLLLRAADLLEPLYDVALGELRLDPHLQADETSFRMQGRRERVFVWTFLSPRTTLYVFSPSRSGETPKTLLEGTSGSLLCDGHSGYNCVTDVDCRTRGGCWCHARRKLFEALPHAPHAREALGLIIDLFMVEREAEEERIVGTRAHLDLRRDKSAQALNKLLLWMKETRPLYEPSSAMGKAIGYIVNQWGRLTVFTDDPCIPIHNNASESALRIIAMSRKSSLFFGNEDAGRRLVILYSVVATCEKNGVNPEVYIRDALLRLPDWPKHRISELLPHRWKERFGTGFVVEHDDAAALPPGGPSSGAQTDHLGQDEQHAAPTAGAGGAEPSEATAPPPACARAAAAPYTREHDSAPADVATGDAGAAAVRPMDGAADARAPDKIIMPADAAWPAAAETNLTPTRPRRRGRAEPVRSPRSRPSRRRGSSRR